MNSQTLKKREELSQLMHSYREACVLGAACELGVFSKLLTAARPASSIADELGLNLRGTQYLLDTLASMAIVTKTKEQYQLENSLQELLDEQHPHTIVPMILHSMSVMRSWIQLAEVVKTGELASRSVSIRGAQADRAAFIAAMHSVSLAAADDLVHELVITKQVPFTHVLDVGGASGTWTLAFLKARSEAKATLFDLPDALAQAQERVHNIAAKSRIRLVAGDFYQDELPAGADLAWVSAIIHQHSRAHNRTLFAKVFKALTPGGRIAIRDFVMDNQHTTPKDGALFAINMLVNTTSGGTFSFDEIASDLTEAGFVDVDWKIKLETMNSVVVAVKPG